MSVEAPNHMSNRRPPRRARAYDPPSKSYSQGFSDLLVRVGRVGRVVKQELETPPHRDAIVFYAGNLGILENRAVSVVGSRDVTRDGRRRAAEVARDLAMAGVTIVSGLAKGVDTTALTSAISNGGRVAAVIGTSLDKAYPAENAKLQRQIYSNHLLMTPFQVGRRALRSNLPVRNRMMAAITDATVIIEASDASGVLHQAAECIRLGRWLFITNSVAQDRALSWPKKFLGRPKVDVFSSTEDIINTMAMGNT
jgi:DNA protecting protein DprA